MQNERNFGPKTVFNHCESMMNDSVYDHLRELSWRRKLTTSEELQLRAWLVAHPEAQADWEAEAGLNEVLGCLPDAPVASNFTARVLQAVQHEQAVDLRQRQRRRSAWWWRRLAPKVALAGIVAAAGFFSYQQVHKARLRAEVKSSLATVSEMPPWPSPEILQNFDAIRALSPPPAADEQLLALLQ